MDELEQSKEHIDEILTNTLTLLDDLSSLSESFKSVETQTSNFEKQCQGLLSAQERDTKLANGIQNNLHYYDFLDPASRRLNAPGAGNTVRDKEFSDMLRRLDVCLDYMETHVSEHVVDIYAPIAYLYAAGSKRGRSLSLEIPTTPNACLDAYPRQLCIFT